jgi:hypothetical protein
MPDHDCVGSCRSLRPISHQKHLRTSLSTSKSRFAPSRSSALRCSASHLRASMSLVQANLRQSLQHSFASVRCVSNGFRTSRPLPGTLIWGDLMCEGEEFVKCSINNSLYMHRPAPGPFLLPAIKPVAAFPPNPTPHPPLVPVALLLLLLPLLFFVRRSVGNSFCQTT